MITRIGLFPLLLLLGPLLVACDWVDSTGTQGVAPRTEVFLDDTPAGSGAIVDEKSRVSVITSRGASENDEQTYQWGLQPTAEGALSSCAGRGGFNVDTAANDLLGACTDSTNCSVGFVQQPTTDGTTVFFLEAPELQASVGLRFGLTVSDVNGIIATSEHDFCFVAINEAPDANDDTFVIREGTREVISVDMDNLLTNDFDDIDVSNSPLTILPQPATDPKFASFFELGDDGSFTYESNLVGLLTDEIDSFEYSVTDGVFTSTASVTLRIVANNQAPEQLEAIPALSATVGESFAENLSLYFADPEEGGLTFSFVDEAGLPTASGLSLDSNGVLSGTPSMSDVGFYALELIISDGGREIESRLSLNIFEPLVVDDNAAPVYIDDTVFNQILFLGASIRAVAAEFADADGDELEYSIFGTGELPEGVTIDPDSGVVSGRPLAQIWVRNLRVQATDPSGATAVSDSFYIRVR